MMAAIAEAYRWAIDETIYPDLLEHGRTRVGIGERKRDWSLNDEERAEKIAIGYLGERAFAGWSDDGNVPVTYLGDEIGTGPDKGDFEASTGELVDIKTQEVLKSTPTDDWNCEVTQEQLTRPVDIYVFAKLLSNREPREVWLVGWMRHEEFLRSANHVRRGEFQKGRRVRYPKWLVTIADLQPLSALPGAIR